MSENNKQKAKKRYHKGGGKEKAKEYYQINKEIIKEKAKNRYQKELKRQYTRD